jgi:POT family proton-dependent oligopeptide transporter
VFWAFFEQAGSSINLFTDRNVDRTIDDVEVKASVFQSVNPAFILLLAPFFSAMWIALARRGLEPSTPVKFGLGIVQLGLGFGVLWLGAKSAGTDGIVALGWLLGGYLLHTMGELCLSPVGLSMITKLSPARIVGLMMGTWFLATAFSQYVAGLIAALTGVEGAGEAEGALPPPSETVMVYGEVFGGIALTAIAAGFVALAVSPWLRKRMHGVH